MKKNKAVIRQNITLRGLFVFFLVSIYSTSYSQNNSAFVTVQDNGKNLARLINELEKEFSVDVISNYEHELSAYTVTGITEKMYMLNFLEVYLKPLKLVPIRKGNVFILIKNDIYSQYGNRKGNFIIVKGVPVNDRIVFTGSVRDDKDEVLIGAQVVITKSNIGATTDIDGNFRFNSYDGIHEIRVSYVGYETIKYLIGNSPLGEIQKMDIKLNPESIQLESVTISATKSDENVQSHITGVSTMNIESIKEIPSFMGEVDVVRSITTLPGVSTAGELSSGFNVRGGDVGQNLILQDGANIYNPTHLFGFFSAFNPDLVSNISLNKGVGPANYGGRISSVLDVKLKTGDAGKYRLKGGVGLVSSRLTFEGPIKKNKASFILGGRISYVNWLIKALNNQDLMDSRSHFNDITGKVFYSLSENDIVSLSGYSSYDNFKLNSDSTLDWSTNNISANWDHLFNASISSKLNLSYSHYQYNLNNADKIDGFEYKNYINNIRLNYDIRKNWNDKLESTLGLELLNKEIEPGELKYYTNIKKSQPINVNNQHAVEGAVYMQNDYEISNKITVGLGLRFSNFWRLGEDNIFIYDFDQLDGRYPTISDSIRYSSGEQISYFNGLEPRISLRYSFAKSSSIKASYYRSYQYVHLISNTVSATPQDFWLMSGPSLKPAIASQFSFGVFSNLNQNKTELSVEGYYKDILNPVDYIEGVNTNSESIEGGLIQGKGLAYGVEFMLKKNEGAVNGFIAYTYSRSLRKFESSYEYKSINEGKLYPSIYDQPHNLSLIINYRLSPYATLTTNFSYSTGRPITVPISKVSYEHYLSVLNYSERNAYRIPDYHRLDISLTIKDKLRQNKLITGEWVLGIYNLYGRKNPYSIFFNGKGTAFKMSIIGTVFPSISYNFKL